MKTKEECYNIAKKYTTKTEFHDKSRKIYELSKKMGWYDEITSHMINPQEEKNKKMYNEALNAALKYKSRKEFKNSVDKKYFMWAQNNRCVSEICGHMKPIGNNYARCIYCYIFSDKSCYVGLTYDLDSRDFSHRVDKNSSVYKHSALINEDIPTPIMLTDYIDKNEASKMEGYFYEKYKNDGFNMLNVAKTGGLGGAKNKKIITKEFCKEKAKECLSRAEFEKKYKYLYNKVKLKKWDSFVFSHMDSEYSKREKARKISEYRRGKKLKIKNLDKLRLIRSFRKVKQYNLNGDLIGEYQSCADASRRVFNDEKHTNGIRMSCEHKTNSYGFKWEFSSENKRTYTINKNSTGNSKKVLQYDLKGTFICEFKSCKDAAIALGHKYSAYSISKCCKGLMKKSLGYIWKYKNNL